MARRRGCCGVKVCASGGRQIEAEPVDLHVVGPVAQRVQHEPRRSIRRRVHRVAAAGDIDVGAVVGLTVVGAVVDAAQARTGPADALLGGVVVHHVEDHLQARLVQELDHALELAKDRLRPASPVLPGRVGGVRREEVERVVAPVVAEAQLQQARLGRERVHRQQLDARDAQREQVLDHRGVGESRVGAVQSRRHSRVTLGQALDVPLVDHGAIERHERLAHAAPIESAVDDDGAVIVEAAGDESARVRVEQQGSSVEGVAGPGRSLDADRVARAGAQQVVRDAPHAAAHVLHRRGGDGPVEIGVVEDHQLHGAGRSRPHPQCSAVGAGGDPEIVQIGAQQTRRRGEQGGRFRSCHGPQRTERESRRRYATPSRALRAGGSRRAVRARASRRRGRRRASRPWCARSPGCPSSAS
jgi:hypothetical protein